MDYIITRDSENRNDELKHWKYIKKIKGKNGKWRYIYDRSELDKYDKEAVVTEHVTTNDGTTMRNAVKYQKSNKLFDSIGSGGGSGRSHISYTKNQGKLSRATAKAEKWIYKNFLSNKSSTRISLNSAVNKAKDSSKRKKEVNKIMNKLLNK